MKNLTAIYLANDPPSDQYDRYCLWQAQQWLAGRIYDKREDGPKGVTIFASARPFPSSTAQEAA